MKFTLLKYLFLLGALAIAIYELVMPVMLTFTMYNVFLGLLLLFVISSITGNLLHKAPPRSKTVFPYYTPGLVTKKMILIGAYIISAFVFWMSHTKILLFGIVLVAILIADIAGLFIKMRKKYYYIYLDEKAILLQQENLKKIFPSHIREIEYRHGIIYLTLTNNHVQLIEPDKISSLHQEEFMHAFIDWAQSHNILFTAEAKEKLGLA